MSSGAATTDVSSATRTTLATSASPSTSSTLASSTTATASASATVSPNPTVVALTTTFTPPASCTEGQLSMMSSPSYFIWLNEPMPVPGTTITDCYPSEFIDGYSSVYQSESSIAPVMSPLICPLNYHTAFSGTSGYIACCPSGYLLAPPTTTVDTNRPAYGGTCYSGFTVGKTISVSAYGTANFTGVKPWSASSSVDQAYAHVIEGYSGASSSSSSKLSGGAIAGIVIGVLAGVALLIALVFFLLRRRRQRAAAAAAAAAGKPGPGQEVEGRDAYTEKPGDEHYRKELSGAADTAPKAELPSPPPPLPPQELDASTPAELDGGYKGAEIESPGVVKDVERQREYMSRQDVERATEGTGTHKEARHDDTPPPSY